MRRLGSWLLTAGLLLFLALLVSQGLPAILATLAAAGWGLAAVTLFHLLPLLIDAVAIRVLYQPRRNPAWTARCRPDALDR